MDRVSFSFREHLCELLPLKVLAEAKKLSGSYGELAQYAFDHISSYFCSVRDGSQVQEFLHYLGSDQYAQTPEEIEAAPKKLVRYVMIRLEDAEAEKVSRETVQRFRLAQEYSFILESSSISKAWVDFAYSLKRLGTVAIEKKLDDDSLALFDKLVTGRKITTLKIYPEAFDTGILEASKSLLCQEQFEELRYVQLTEASRPPVGDLLEFWSKNSEKLRGKHFIMTGECRNSVQELGAFFQRNGQKHVRRIIEKCSKEECDSIDKEYRHNHYAFVIPSCVFKHEEGEGDGRRKIYITFECTKLNDRQPMRHATYKGPDNLRLWRHTKLCHTMFA
uniref:FTH domain-containing protein n=1 Tax=Steinernema glaseri TaxID=37863 RepID=A0A1I7YWT9_9BILA